MASRDDGASADCGLLRSFQPQRLAQRITCDQLLIHFSLPGRFSSVCKKREEKKQIREKFKIIEQINDSPFILLDVTSNIISRFKHINEVANYINEHPQTIRNAVKRKTIIQKKYIAIFNDINKK